MKIIAAVAIVFLTFTSNVFADDPASVQEGAEQFNWDTCIANKSNGCLNGCATSPDINCKDNCLDLAKDKCQSLGIAPT